MQAWQKLFSQVFMCKIADECSDVEEVSVGSGLFSHSEFFQFLIKPGWIFPLLSISWDEFGSFCTLLASVQHAQVAFGQCLVEPYCKVVFIGGFGDDVIDLIDDTGPMLDFGKFIDFLVHEELSNEGYFDEFGEWLDDRMWVVVVGKGGGSVLVEESVIGGGFIL